MALLRLPATALFLALSFAPFQCAHEPGPNRRVEDDPAEAIYKLAERFKAAGKGEAQTATLKYVIERYPTSRYSKMAATDLEEMGPAPAGAPSPAATPQ